MPVEERSLSSETTPKVMRNWRLGNLRTPKCVQDLRTTLHAKAKERSELRFHALYDKIYHRSVLIYAYQCCRRNKGAAGTDGQTFDDTVWNDGSENWRNNFGKVHTSRNRSDASIYPSQTGKTDRWGSLVLKTEFARWQ